MMPVTRKDVLNRAAFNDPACVHDSYIIASLGYYAQVMSYQQHRSAELFL
jgi:hypothetical protein